jgi:hypothetical protein
MPKYEAVLTNSYRLPKKSPDVGERRMDISGARFLKEKPILKNAANGTKKRMGRGRTENHHLMCERCEEGRIADVAEENKGEKKDKILNLTQELSNSQIQPGFKSDICPSVLVTVPQN